MTDDKKGTGITPAALVAMIEFAKTGDPEMLNNAVAASTPGGIEAQEARGQKELVNSTKLPKEMSKGWGSCTREEHREAFETLGFKFGEDVDELFVEAEMPEGWEKRASDHSMHSVIVDEWGRERVRVFFKAAFYDRRADMRLKRRLSVGRDFEYDSFDLSDEERKIVGTVRDFDGTILFETDNHDYDPNDRSREALDKMIDLQDEVHDQAVAWAKQHVPDWKDSLAYWDGLPEGVGA